MSEPQYQIVSKFDRIMGSLDGRPDVTKSAPSTIRLSRPLVGTETFIVQTYRERENGDTIFVEYASSDGLVRMALPPAVADTIARQRDSLTTKVRRKIGRDAAAARKARGELPGFMKNGKRPGKKKAAKPVADWD